MRLDLVKILVVFFGHLGHRYCMKKIKSTETILQFWSFCKLSKSQFNEGFNKMKTPLLCVDPCEKKMTPPHSLLQIISSLNSEYVSCRK